MVFLAKFGTFDQNMPVSNYQTINRMALDQKIIISGRFTTVWSSMKLKISGPKIGYQIMVLTFLALSIPHFRKNYSKI